MKRKIVLTKLFPGVFLGVVSVSAAVLLSGCVTGYEAGTVGSAAIRNPSIGWNGYSVKVPANYTVFDPSQMDGSDLSNKASHRRAILEDEKQYAADLAVAYHERFLLEGEDDESYIIFISDTYEFSKPLSMFTSIEKDYLLRQFVNEKLVKMNDTDAFQELITVNGHRAFHIRGDWKPYFVKDAEPIAYEGYLVLGDLKEVYWFEGFAMEETRKSMQKAVRTMVDSLEI
jgi:hypothetical protein